MKQLGILMGALLALCALSTTNAASVQYQITATHANEAIWGGTRFVPSNGGDLFTNGATVTAIFLYDSSVAITSANNAGNPDLSTFGPSSYYEGSVADFSGSVEGHSFYVASGHTIVADSNETTAASNEIFDGVFHVVGAANPNQVTDPGLSGFSLGDFDLIGMVAYSVGNKDFLSSQALPEMLSVTGSTNVGLNLIFKNSAGTYRSANFWYGSITPVPLPGALVFFLSGLVGLAAGQKLKAKNA